MQWVVDRHLRRQRHYTDHGSAGMLREFTDAAHISRWRLRVRGSERDQEPALVLVGEIERRIIAVTETRAEDPRRNIEFIHDVQQRARADSFAPVATEIARNVRVCAITEKCRSGLFRNEVDPNIDNIVSAHSCSFANHEPRVQKSLAESDEQSDSSVIVPDPSSTRGFTLKRTSRLIAAGLTLAMIAAACGEKEKAKEPITTAGGVSTTLPAEPTKATEVGITETEISIAVLADVENPIVPGLFAGSRDALLGFETYVNEELGGIAGRKLKVNFIDTKLNAEATKTAMQEACEKNFALVGTTIVFVSSMDPIIKCNDLAGDATGIPDIAGISVDPSQQRSPMTFSALPPERVYPDGATQKFRARTGAYTWLLENVEKDLHGVYLQAADSQTATNGNRPRFYALQNVLGIKKDAEFPVSGFAEQVTYGPYVQALKDNKSNFAESGGGYQSLLKFRREAEAQGVDTVKVWACVLTCYDSGFLEEGREQAEGTYVHMPFVPFYDEAEQQAVPAAAAFVKYTGADKADGFGVQAWASALLFKETVEAVVAKDGINGLTRASLLAALSTVNSFNADGLLGDTDVAGRLAAGCIVVMQVEDGKFVRKFPTEPGKLDCDPKNISEIEKDLQD